LKAEASDRQSVIEFDTPQDRRGFLRYAALIGVGSGLAAVACGTQGSSSTAPAASPKAATGSPQANPFGQGDVGVLNYALTLEYLEADFYARGVAANILGEDAKFIGPIAQHEAAHVQALLSTLQQLGATPVTRPAFKYPDGTFTNRDKFLATAQTFEETGVKAYHGQVPVINDKNILAAAASIAGVESRHAAVIADILGKKQVPAPFESHAGIAETVTAIKPFMGS
jgi:rubrerythrin